MNTISKFEVDRSAAGLLSEQDLIAQMFAHIDGNTTDKGESSWREPAANYQSQERFDAERTLMRQRWTVFCPSVALAKSGDYIARDAAGVPLIVVRGIDGEARAFRNACRHRGVQVADGSGCTSVFVCPYHGWSYGTDGTLRSVPHKDGFPDVDKDTRGLVAVECQEKNGLIFVRQEAGHRTGDAETDLPDLIPDEFRVVKTAPGEIEANWKLHLESSLEGYHIRSTHQTTFFPVQYDNLTVVESFGQNSRIAFPYQSIEGLRSKPKSSWSANGRMTMVYHLFPNVIISTFPDCMQLVVLEPITPTLTRQHMFLLADCADDSAELDTIFEGQEFAAVGAIEDREVVLSAQRGLAAGANEFLEFGLFESAIGKFHAELTDELDALSG